MRAFRRGRFKYKIIDILGADQHSRLEHDDSSQNNSPPSSEAEVLEASEKNVKGPAHIAKRVRKVSIVQLFTSAVRRPKPDVRCLVFSWYGYSSLKMFEAKPRACLNKVICRIMCVLIHPFFFHFVVIILLLLA